jgi:hypothetical protein
MISNNWYHMDEPDAKAVFFTAVAAAAANVNVWFVGPPGWGKSVYVKQLAKFLRYGEEPYSFTSIVLLYLSTIELQYLKTAIAEPLKESARHPYVLLFDDFTYAPTHVQAHTNELFASRQIKVAGLNLHEGTRIFAASTDETTRLISNNTPPSTLSTMLVLRYPISRSRSVGNDLKADRIETNLRELVLKVQNESSTDNDLYDALENAIEEAIQKHHIDPETRFCLAMHRPGKVNFLNFEPNIEVIARLAANDTVGVEGRAIDIKKLDPVLLEDQVLQQKVYDAYELIQNEIHSGRDPQVDKSFSDWIKNKLGSRLVPSSRTAEMWRKVVLALCRMYEVGAIERNELDYAIRHASLGTIGDIVITSPRCNVSRLMTILLDNKGKPSNISEAVERAIRKKVPVDAFDYMVAQRIMNDIEEALQGIKKAAPNEEKATKEGVSEEMKGWIDKLATVVTPLVAWAVTFDKQDPKLDSYRMLLPEIPSLNRIFKTGSNLYSQLTRWLFTHIEHEIGKGTKLADIVKDSVSKHMISVRQEVEGSHQQKADE